MLKLLQHVRRTKHPFPFGLFFNVKEENSTRKLASQMLAFTSSILL
jgi:hypothetical protein